MGWTINQRSDPDGNFWWTGKAEYHFPVITAGIKVFVVSYSSFIVQTQYEQIINYMGIDNSTNSNLTLAIGIAFYF